ncbi:hypothetical protein SUVZ_07G0110 [Saccharomyces uvarum]|uniref:Uncharacterized protein n=1 Tax=Saccharomyces uvarum TaxID=230603 RepID=A0ABN8WW18_SACUV|nr:hypothetical protein SUVZ_07G0110 [Saccharomyces uvarum]
MNIGVWEVKLSPCSHDVGGYSVLLGSLKENIKLERRAQKYLKELTNLHVKPLKITLSGKIDKIDREKYLLEVIHSTFYRQRTTLIVNKTWNTVNLKQDNTEEPLYEFPKEKLKVEKQDMLFFKWMKTLSTELKFTLQQSSPKHSLSNSNMKLSWHNIPILRQNKLKKKASRIDLKQMPSALETQFNKVKEEKLNNCVKFSDKPLSDWEPAIFEQTYEKYFLNPVLIKKPLQRNRKCCKHDFEASTPNWVVTFPDGNQEYDIFERNYNELFDTHFNKLEFFKIRTKKPERSKPVKKKVQDIWSLDKGDLKVLVWDPLKTFYSYSWNTILDNDVINEKAYSIKPIKMKFQKLYSSSLDLIDNQRKKFGTIKLAVGIPNEKTTEDTSFEESERNDITVNSTFGLEKDDHLSSSKVDINTSLAPQKRSFIDDELISILATKRKFKKHKEHGGSATNISSTSYLMNSGTYANIPTETSITKSVCNDKRELSFNSSSIIHSIFKDDIKNKCIAVNTNKMMENHKVIQALCQNSQLDLIEQPYFGECDFIIDHSTCLLKIQMNQFLQLKDNGSLYYSKTINDLLTEFHRVIIIVQFPEILQKVDPDLFWKVRFYLLHPRIEAFFTYEDMDVFIDWIKYFITKWAFSYDDGEDRNIANDDVLLDLGFNILLVRKIYRTYSLQEFLMAVIREQSQAVELLTVSQMSRLRKLLTLEW